MIQRLLEKKVLTELSRILVNEEIDVNSTVYINALNRSQDLWEIVIGTDTTPPSKENAEALIKWNIKAGKASFVLKTIIDEDLLEHIRDDKTPKTA
ncbi:hypothetical protein PVK06_003044 [Gossypium arboreum]|uniref:Uncharacterized protein n=1 Tax=Gossypium arboreum TaxID=29729 RepID=A0ABR0R598_GOSAR|nr:hypothetical protein PVK06_003044 [Gossypium arboreum]